MLGVKVVCVGRLKEKYWYEAAAEYLKRLSAYCKIEVEELAEARLRSEPSEGEIEDALAREAASIELRLPPSSLVVALCVEGKQVTSPQLAQLLEKCAGSGVPRMTFLIGGSFGLHQRIKERANLKLSMSEMTFPHHLARIMLLEQLYRGFKINEGSRYHK